MLSYKRLLRNTGNFFVVNLAIADLLITSVVGPFNMIGNSIFPPFYTRKVLKDSPIFAETARPVNVRGKAKIYGVLYNQSSPIAFGETS